jgi:hypothetical protein
MKPLIRMSTAALEEVAATEGVDLSSAETNKERVALIEAQRPYLLRATIDVERCRVEHEAGGYFVFGLDHWAPSYVSAENFEHSYTLA